MSYHPRVGWEGSVGGAAAVGLSGLIVPQLSFPSQDKLSLGGWGSIELSARSRAPCRGV